MCGTEYASCLERLTANPETGNHSNMCMLQKACLAPEALLHDLSHVRVNPLQLSYT